MARRGRRRRGRLTAAWSFSAASAVGVAAWLGRRRASAGGDDRRGAAEANKRVSRRVVEELFNEGRLEVADELAAPQYVGHDAALPEPSHGPDGLRHAAAGYRAGFPDLRLTIEAQLAEGDLVSTRWRAVGTHTGDFWGLPPTGRQATVSGVTVDRVAGGRLVESWTSWDALGLMQQLGVVPTEAHT